MLWLWTALFFISQSKALETQFSGTLSTQSDGYLTKLSDPTRQLDAILSLQPEFDLKFNKKSRMHFKPLLRSNVTTEEKQEQLYLNVQEAYWEIKAHPLRVRLGQNIYNWGVLDGYSTQDVINGRILYNPLSADKRGAPTVDLNYENDLFQMQALYIPTQARTLLPSSDSRWLPRDVIFNTQNATDESVTFLLPQAFDYYFPRYSELDHALSNNYGFKISSRYNTLDISAMYFEGSSSVPEISLIASGNLISIPPAPSIIQATSNVGIVPVYYRQQAFGASLVWAPSDIIFKFESTYIKSISDSPTLSPWSLQNGLGIEIPWNIGTTNLISVFQIYYGKNEDPAENMVTSSGRLFDRAALMALRWSLTSDTNLLASYLYDYDGGSSYAHLAYDIKLLESLKAEISGDLIEGKRDTFLGTYTKNDRISFKLSYLW